MPVPSSYNDVLADSSIREHVGDVWYQTVAWIPRWWAGQRIVLRFGSATHRATVWANESLVAEHEGGYLPFEADLSSVVTPGTAVRITVAVNNELNWNSIPPGVIEETSHGRRQRYFHDFFNYAGLHRTVWLYATSPNHISDVTVRTTLDGSTGVVSYEVGLTAPPPAEVRATLYDSSSTAIADAGGETGVIRIPHAHLWAPGDGHLYELRVQLFAAGALVDQYSQPVGIREVRIDGSRFLINGRPFYFTGAGKHEDALLRGRGHDDVTMVHDFALMDWLGANSFRTSHYPYAEEVLEYADRHGIVVIGESPAVGLNLVIAQSGVVGPRMRPTPTFSSQTISEATQERHLDAIRAMIARDQNHPCVVVWSIANEPDSATAEARRYFEPLFEEARRLDPSRPVGFTNFTAHADRCHVSGLSDVIMLNRYYGWYTEGGDLDAAEAVLRAELSGWRESGKPIIFTEYGADSVAGLHSALAGVQWTEEYQAEMLRMYHRVFDDTPEVVGEHVWAFADFATASGTMRVDGNRKGIFTRDRRPKAAAHLLRERWRRLRSGDRVR